MAEDLSGGGLPHYSLPASVKPGSTKYDQLLVLLEEIRKDVKPTYIGNKAVAERLKRSITHARILVKDINVEAERDRQKYTAEHLNKGL